MNIQDIKRIAHNTRTTVQNKVSSATGKKLMIVAGGVALLAGGAGTAIAMQSHAQSRVATSAGQVQLTDSADQSTGQSTTSTKHTKPAKPAAVGTVTAISGSTLTVTDKQSNTTYTVDASNATITKVTAPSATTGTPTTPPAKPTETTISVSGIAVGDTVMVQGTVSGTSVTATKIVDGQMFGRRGGMHGPKPAAQGTVTAVSGTTLTVTDKQSGTSYTVDASNATVKKIVAAVAATTTAQPAKPTITTITASDIAVGDTVMVQGTVSGTNVTATSVTDGNFPAPRFGGRHGGQKPQSGSTGTTSTNN
jgi:hypothetical protein